MINVGGLCGIITTNIERYAHVAGFGFAFMVCLILVMASTLIFNIEYKKFGEFWSPLPLPSHCVLH